MALVLEDPWSYRSFLGVGDNQQIGRGIAEKHVQAGGSLTGALEAYMRLRQAMILASRDVFRESDRPFFDLMTRLNRCIDRVLFAIAEGYFSRVPGRDRAAGADRRADRPRQLASFQRSTGRRAQA